MNVGGFVVGREGTIDRNGVCGEGNQKQKTE